MPGIVRQPDIDSRGNPNITFSPDTILNEFNAARFSDLRTPCSSDNIGQTLAEGSVFINNLHAQFVSHPNRGCDEHGPTVQIQGSGNIIVN